MIEPVIEELALEYRGKLKVTKIDVDANPRTAERYGIPEHSSTLSLQGGLVVEQIIGAAPKPPPRRPDNGSSH